VQQLGSESESPPDSLAESSPDRSPDRHKMDARQDDCQLGKPHFPPAIFETHA
jgi:hypothetical protein